MSQFLKSVLFGLAGAAVGVLAVYLAEQFQNRRAGKHPLYNVEYVFSFPSNIDSNSQADPRPIDVVKKRLSVAGYDHALTEEGGRYMLTANGLHDYQFVYRMLTSPGRLKFVEPYVAQSLIPLFISADSLLQGIYKSQQPPSPAPPTDTVNLPVPDIKYDDPTTYSRPLLSLIQLWGGSPDLLTAQIGGVGVKDTQKLRERLSTDSVRLLFPKNLEFIYGGVERYSHHVALYAIPLVLEANEDVLNEFYITSLSVRPSGQLGPDYSEINMKFNEKGAIRWEELTRKNVNRCIAIVVDNTMLSAPTVTEPITGGDAVINGPPYSEAKLLEVIIKGGRLDVTPDIMSEKITPASAVFRKVRSMSALWLSGLVAFILVFTTYFILRRPKKNN